jgi:Flp pilus assembly protein TadG
MHRLKTFCKSERGNVLVLSAVAMPMLLASAGFGVDTIRLAVLKRQMQRAADSGAIAGAFAMTQAPDSKDDEKDAAAEKRYATEAATRDLLKNKTTTLFGVPVIETGPSLGFDRTVRVDLTARPRMPFMSIFTATTTNITATATAALADGGRFCVLSLWDGTTPGIETTGHSTLDLGCGMATNSRGASAITAEGSSTVIASPLMAPGGIPGSTRFAADTKLQPYGAAQEDPFAHIDVPPFNASNCPAIEVQKNDPPKVLTTGCYSSLDIKGTLIASGNIVVYGGNINFDAGATVTGTDVTFFLTGPDGAGGTYSTNGHPKLTLSAPTSGTYENILFYRDRGSPLVEIKLNGNAQSSLTGGLYFPTADVEVNGNAGFQATCFQLVGRRLSFSGNATIRNRCSGAGGGRGFTLEYVRLVK